MIAITGGGTGGHLAIAKAFANELNSRGIKAIFIGSSSGQDKMWFENSDIFEATYFLNSSGVVNKRGFGRGSEQSRYRKAYKITKGKEGWQKTILLFYFSVNGISVILKVVHP